MWDDTATSRSQFRHEILSGGMRGIGMSDGPQYRKWKTSIESYLLLRDLLKDEDPLQYKDRLRRCATSIVCCVAYGRRIKTLDGEIVVNNVKTATYFGKWVKPSLRLDPMFIWHAISRISVPGKFLVDSKFLQWFRWEPERRRAVDTEIYLTLLNQNDVKRQMKDGIAHPSVAIRGLEKQQELGLTDVETAYALSAPWAAGTGMTVATIEVFLLAMLQYPAVMKKAQVEIDSVVGSERMPDFKDFDALPYVQAVIKETMSAITKDETVFANAEEFISERFNASDRQMVNFTLPFGFGRRQILWVFNVMPPVDEKGNEVLPSTDSFTTGLTTRPEPFKCYFEPRSSQARDIIIQEAENADIDACAWK
ncbi:cytochrome P450 [Desarmillaria tabescens]|uniref:Cytochrome P450 n=1 Tax=Armillaria tabescens TaxID=1929756 RepID=A0AA39NBC9_ARMTA|nr:cytochrome P450 [Desarmillaria tabescens]KAK0462498.1 cytochrome P450 [Desarmillaria tabescens]